MQFKGITLRGESGQNKVDDITMNSCGFGEGPYTMPLCTVQVTVLHPDSVTEVLKKSNTNAKQHHPTVVAMESSTSCVHSQDNDSSFG